MTPQEFEYRKKCHNDFLFFCRNELRIRDKTGSISSLKLNRAQSYIHDKLEKQRQSAGKVRALILKGRQQGCSTLIGARFYHLSTNNKGMKAFILTHQQEATDNLFAMTQRYYDNSVIHPQVSNKSAKELVFASLDSEYKVGTAGSKAVGRSQTIQLFHGSEVAFWPNASDHVAGVLQAVPDLPNTEIILESTANGIGNLFYDLCMEAISGRGQFELIFVPWFWQDEYRTKTEPLEHDETERLLIELYKLDDEQLMWRRNKIKELREVKLFNQEYPCSIQEAFINSVDNPYIKLESVQKAMATDPNALMQNNKAPVVIGCDVARGGGDYSIICIRQGRVVRQMIKLDTDDTMQIVGQLVWAAKEYQPKKIFIDVIGVGAGVVDRMREMGYSAIVVAVNSAETKSLLHSDRFANKRAELWGLMKEWLEDEPVSLPESEALKSQLISLSWIPDSNGRIKLQDKSELKKSPDDADALALTFAQPVMAYRPIKIERKNLGFV